MKANSKVSPGGAIQCMAGDLDKISGPSTFNLIRCLSGDESISTMRSSDLLRDDEWREIDETLIPVVRRRTIALNDLRENGLIKRYRNIGTTISEYEVSGDMTEAEQTMDGRARGIQDRPGYGMYSYPIPITFKDFELNARNVIASRNRGASIDMEALEIAGRRVAEKLEDMIFFGSDVQLGDNKIYGYCTHPYRMKGTLSSTVDLTKIGTEPGGPQNGSAVVTDFIRMVRQLNVNGYDAPLVAYISNEAAAGLRQDFKQQGSRTIADRILDIPEITAIRPVPTLGVTKEYIEGQTAENAENNKPVADSDFAPTAENRGSDVLLIPMDRLCHDLAIAEDVMVVEWSVNAGFTAKYKVFCAMVPRIKPDMRRKVGILHWTKA